MYSAKLQQLQASYLRRAAVVAAGGAAGAASPAAATSAGAAGAGGAGAGSGVIVGPESRPGVTWADEAAEISRKQLVRVGSCGG